MSTGRTTTLPGVDMVNWLSRIDPQKHGTVFRQSFTSAWPTELSRSTSVLQPAAAHFVAQLCFFSFFFFSVHLPNCLAGGMKCNIGVIIFLLNVT